MAQDQKKKRVLVTGLTGHIGGLLVPRLVEKGYLVRCLVRNPKKIDSHPWLPKVEVVKGDVTIPGSLTAAMKDVHAAYYFVHSMASGDGYVSKDIVAAKNFAQAAEAAGVKQIIFLGGLVTSETDAPEHLRSRIETGKALRTSSVPVTEFRAGVIIGPGSTSFEMIRFITEQLPVLIAPRSVRSCNQPLATQSVLEYLLAALDTPACLGKVIEIAGPQVYSYADILLTYARLRGLRRALLILPFIPLDFMAFWVERLTPIPASIARQLIDSLRGDSVLRDGTAAKQIFPDIKPIGYPQAVHISLEQLTPQYLDPLRVTKTNKASQHKHKGFLIDQRQVEINAPGQTVYQVVTNLGGVNGWLYMNWLWRLRGWFDQLIGGPGMRGRPANRELRLGDVVDYYRVDEVLPGKKIRLRSELHAPGEGWMEWQVDSGRHGSVLIQRAYFAPKGLGGFLYWHLLAPLHHLVFRGLITAIARLATN